MLGVSAQWCNAELLIKLDNQKDFYRFRRTYRASALLRPICHGENNQNLFI